MPHLLQGEVGRFAQRPEAAGWLTEVLSGGSNVLHALEDIWPAPLLPPRLLLSPPPPWNIFFTAPVMREKERESDGLLCCIKMIQDAASVNPRMFLPLMQARCVYVCMCVGIPAPQRQSDTGMLCAVLCCARMQHKC